MTCPGSSCLSSPRHFSHPTKRVGRSVNMQRIPFEVVTTAAVDLLALVSASIFMWRAARRAWRFIRLSRSASVRTAVRRSRLSAHRQAFRCATDLHYYASRLTLLFCANLVGLAGLILVTASTPRVREQAFSIETTSEHTLTLVILVAFISWTTVRMVKLARRVMVIRRRLRHVRSRIS